MIKMAKKTRKDFPAYKPRSPEEDIVCKDCVYRFKDDPVWGYRKGNCEQYTSIIGKPVEILFDGADCEKYKKDEGGE